MKTMKIAKLNIENICKATKNYYAIFITVLIVLISSTSLVSNNINLVRMSGVEFSTIIFIFVGGLNSFKSNFYFAKANNISNKSFIKGILMSIVPIAFFVAFIDIIINRIINIFINCPTMYDMSYNQFYASTNMYTVFLGTLIFQFVFLILAYLAGVTITIAYYKASKIMKIVISIAPVIFFMGYNSLIHSGVEIVMKIDRFIMKGLGIFPLNIYNTVTSFIAISVILSCIIFILGRKVAIQK